MSVSAESFSVVADLVRKEAFIELPVGKEYLVASRLAPIARELEIGSVDLLVKELGGANGSQLKKRVVDALTTNETLFFRDAHPFESLRKEILPSIIQRRRPFKSLRILSAACSTGQEPYTVAMILAHYFKEVLSWDLTFIGTDYSERVLEKARAAKFSQLEVTRGLPAIYLAKYFRRQGSEWLLHDKIRDMVQFQQQNLVKPWRGIGTFDLILCRNVLIYFSQDNKCYALREAAGCLDPDGVLILGSTESILGLDLPLEQRVFGASKVYQNKTASAA